MKNKIIQLIKEVKYSPFPGGSSDVCVGNQLPDHVFELIADHLLSDNSAATMLSNVATKTNKPLTLEELRHMEGEIVFITPLNDWAKVMHYGLVYFGTEKHSLWQDTICDYGEKWLAYKRKPMEHNING